jgi:hypothetical protein
MPLEHQETLFIISGITTNTSTMNVAIFLNHVEAEHGPALREECQRLIGDRHELDRDERHRVLEQAIACFMPQESKPISFHSRNLDITGLAEE